MVNQLHPQAQLLHGLHGVLIPEPVSFLLRRENKIALQQPDTLLDPIFLRGGFVYFAEVDNQARFHAEDRVRRLVRITTEVESTA